jgi:UDP-N-acetylglucosamine 2-epimerase (non-hydrolysing)
VKKLLIVFGTRPEAIKMAPVIKKLEEFESEFKTTVCVTAQHRQMLDDVLDIFRIKPAYDLNIMVGAQSLFYITQAALLRMGDVLEKEKPDLVLVHGDTTTTFAASLAAFYKKVPVGHVEAGLRTGNKYKPFPEEMNRKLCDAISTLYFTPTQASKKSLLKENTDKNGIFVTGNTVIDALNMALKAKKDFTDLKLKNIFSRDAGKYRYIALTAHRRENFGRPFENAFNALRAVAIKHSDIRIIYPVHLNPNVQLPAKKILGRIPNIFLVPPVNYFDMANLIKRSYLVITDSGGIQEEAPSLGKPVLVLREVTERPEAVKAGTVRLVGTDGNKICSQISLLLNNRRAYEKMAHSVNPYGDGRAAIRTVQAIRYYFCFQKNRPQEFK